MFVHIVFACIIILAVLSLTAVVYIFKSDDE